VPVLASGGLIVRKIAIAGGAVKHVTARADQRVFQDKDPATLRV
jgi:hypothetical protein